MPFQLRNSSATFQKAMNQLLAAHTLYVCAYVDDVAVFSETWEEHMIHLAGVLGTIGEAGATVNWRNVSLAKGR